MGDKVGGRGKNLKKCVMSFMDAGTYVKDHITLRMKFNSNFFNYRFIWKRSDLISNALIVYLPGIIYFLFFQCGDTWKFIINIKENSESSHSLFEKHSNKYKVQSIQSEIEMTQIMTEAEKPKESSNFSYNKLVNNYFVLEPI